MYIRHYDETLAGFHPLPFLFQGRSLVSILMAQVRRYNIVVPLSPLETLSEKGEGKEFFLNPDGSKRIIDLWVKCV